MRGSREGKASSSVARRFGAPEKVDFGGGCKPIKSEKSAKDLIVTFDAAGNGFTDDNFAAKLIGKTARGKLLFGYARLPWLNYLEAVLSASPPSIAKKGDDFMIAVEVQNFGQVASKPAPLKVVCNTDGREVEAASGTLPALDPFEKSVVELTCGNIFKPGVAYATRVIIHPDGQHPVVLQRSLHLAKEPK